MFVSQSRSTSSHIESVLGINEFKTSSLLKADAIRQSNPEQEKKLKELVDKANKHIDGCGYDD